MRSYHYLLFAAIGLAALHAIANHEATKTERAEDRVDRLMCERSSDGTYIDRRGRVADCSELEKT